MDRKDQEMVEDAVSNAIFHHKEDIKNEMGLHGQFLGEQIERVIGAVRFLTIVLAVGFAGIGWILYYKL